MTKKNIFVFHISIAGSKPGIWRDLRAPGDFTLAHLHKAIQVVFGWTDSHLHSFTIKGRDYMMGLEEGMDMYDDDPLIEDDFRLDDLGLQKKERFSYLYDFGDSWEHTITVSEVLPFNEEEEAPLCLGGKYACPIEDSGGVWGYAEILDILKDPGREDYEETLEWAGNYDPLAFDIDEVNRTLKKTFKRVSPRSGGAKKAKPGAGKTGGKASGISAVKASAEKAGEPAGKTALKKTAEKAGGPAAKKTRRGPPDGKLTKLYELMGRVVEMKPWEKLWDTDFVLIELPGREEPVMCSVMGKGDYNFGIVVYPGFASIVSLLRMLDSESDNPLVVLNYQDCLLCQLGQREDLFPEERDRLKELGIRFRGRNKWVYFRKASPGYSPWYVDGKEAGLLIDVLTRFIEAYAAFDGGLPVDFEDGELISHLYSEKDGRWITVAGRMPPIPMLVNEFKVKGGDVEPLRFKEQLKTTVEAETLCLPHALGTNKAGVPILIRINVLIDNKSGVILDQRFIGAGEDPDHIMIDMLFNYITDHGRPETVMVRDRFAAAVLQDFCGKTGIDLVHSEGMPAVDRFSGDLPSFLSPTGFSADE
jgi:hypothetical protein